MTTFKLGQSVAVLPMAHRTDNVGKIVRLTERGYTVRLANWQADGVHLDVDCAKDEVEGGHGRAKTCRCCFCR